MILPEETFPAIDIYKLIKFVVCRAEGKEISIGNFSIIDVNDKDDFDKEHIVSAQHYDRRLLSRNHFETETIAPGRTDKIALLIYGRGSGSTTAALIQRGYHAIQIQGTLPLFRQLVPEGLCYPESNHLNIGALKEALDHRRNAPRGERLWRSTSATRLRSMQSQTRIRRSTPSVHRQPWR